MKGKWFKKKIIKKTHTHLKKQNAIFNDNKI